MLWSLRRILIPLIITVSPLLAFPQVGPMGIGNQNGTPTSAGPQPRLLLWLDGSSASPYNNGFNLNIWNDKSGNEHNFTATSANRPSVAIAGGPSGTPALVFNFTPIGRRLECPDFELTDEGYSIYFVLRSEDDNYSLFSYSTPSSEREMLIYDDSGIRQQMVNTLSRTSNIGSLSDDNWNYGGITWRPTPPSPLDENNWEYSDSAAYETTFGTFGNISLSPNGKAIIGDIEDPGGGFATQPRPNSFEGIIAEIFIYEGRISRAATRLLTTYLWVKYGIPGATPADEYNKFNGNYSSLGGSYYSPIGIGNDISPNGGSINEARSEGLVLRVNSWNASTSYLCAAPVGSSPTGLPGNSVVSSNLTGTSPSVLERWSRTWEIAGVLESDGTQEYEIAFDFGEGIGGDVPQNKDNFVLLYRDTPTGNFSVLPITNDKKFISDDELVFRVQKQELTTPGRYYTIGTTDASSSLTGNIKRTWYAYQTGDWSDPFTWTLDGSAAPVYVNPNATTPAQFDDVFIGAGRAVTVDVTLSDDFGDLTVFGTLDCASTPQASFQDIRGSGLIRCSSGNFPQGNTTGFADPDFGGTLEYYGSGGFTQTESLTVNKLKINLSSTSATMTWAADLTTNGLLEVNQGTFVVNNSASTPTRTLVSNDAVLVESNGIIRVSTAGGLTRHEWYFYDDLINNGGEIRFTNRTVGNFSAYSNNETQDIVTAYFSSGSKNQRLIANGLSYFSRIVIDKGVDMTYILSISSNNPSNFKLLGPCDFAMAPANYTSAAGNQNSFALINGTAEIKENIFIPLLTNNTNGIYNINNTAELWVNGGEVTKGPLGGPGSASAIVPYGNIRVTDGVLNAFCNSGITLRENALVQIDGGEVNANSLRTSFLGADQIGGVIINGGVVNIDGTQPGGIGNNKYYTFCLSYPGNLFRMTGGVLNVTGPSGGGGGTNGGLIFINSAPQNTSVTGGTVNLDISNSSNNHRISSTAAFWNLTLTRSISSGSNHFRVLGGTVGDDAASQATMENQPLIVRNNLTITGPNNPTLSMEGDPAADLYIHGNLEMGSGAVYNHNNNTTHFVGGSNSFLSFEGSNTFPFYNLVIEKELDSRRVDIAENGPNPSMDILGNLNIEKGFLENNNRRIEVKGNITNRSKIGTGSGSSGDVIMNGTGGQQQIISDGGIFHGLLIDNPDGVRLTNDELKVRRRLRLDDGNFFVGDQKLRMETTFTPFSGTGASNFVVCSGNPSAGGVEIFFHSGSQNSTFPIGVSTGVGLKYTPAVIVVGSSFVDSGFVQIAPVDTLLQTVELDGGEPYLNYYWKVNHSEFDDIPSVSHRFQFDYSDTVGTAADLASGRVLTDFPFEREMDELSGSPQSHVNVSSRFIFYNGTDVAGSSSGNGTPLVNANYTAGAVSRFPAGTSPEIYYSRSNTVGANWDQSTNWTRLSDCTGCTDVYDYHNPSNGGSSIGFPEEGDIAIIGFDVTNPYRPHVYDAPVGGIEAAQIIFTPLQDASGNRQPRYSGPNPGDIGILRPTLRISNTSDIIKVARISGEGELMISGDIDFSVTDLGDFLSEDSSVVVVNHGNLTENTLNFLPSVVPNLFLAHTNTLISSDLRVRGNLEVAGISRLRLNETANGNIEIDGDLILDRYQVTSGTSPRVLFNKRGILKTIEVHGNVKLFGDAAYVGINPAAGGPVTIEPWTPDELSGFLWFDAQDATTLTPSTPGSNISAWENRASGSSYTVTQSTPANQPLYLASGFNGYPTLEFDGTDFLSIAHDPIFNLSSGQDFEIFSVVKSNSTGSRRAIYAKGQTSPDDFLLYQDLNPYRLYMDANALSVRSPSNLGTNENLGWARRQGNTAFMYNTIGGTITDNGVSGANNNSNTHDVTIGAANDGTTRHWIGEIGEIFLIKRALTTEERQQMEGYLAHKWGLEGDLPNGHPYRFNPPLLGGAGDQPAQLIVDGDIIQNLSNSSPADNGLELYQTGAETHVVNLVLSGDGENEFKYQNGPTPRFWKITVDKGINTSSSFAFKTNVDIAGPSDEPEKPVDIQNGLVIFDDPNIDLTLSSGGGDFIIPGTGGLQIDDGQYNIIGNQTGLLLSGELNITGGSLSIGDTEGLNNYIEYGGGSSPKIDISGGTLVVGSQIRRNLSSTGGALDYRQSGGDVILGRYSAPEANRGILEILNSGSRFDYTGGTLTFVRGVNTSTSASLLLNPTNHNVSGSSEIFIGNADSPSGAAIQNFSIQSAIPLSSLTINSTNSPVVNVLTNDLELNGDLTIESGATLNCGERNLTLHGDVSNDGTLSSVSGEFNLIHPLTATISGSGIFDLFDLRRTGGSGGLTNVQTDLLVNNNFVNDEGEMDFGVNTLTVNGNVTTDGVLSFDTSSDGLIFNGSENQILTRSVSGNSEIDILTINNEFGVTVPAGFFEFRINDNLRLEKGVLSLTGNLLEMATGAVFTPVNPFGETNMIVTGGAFANFGLLLNVPANSTDDILVPLGIDRYMPVNLDFSQSGYSSGSTASSYLLRLNVPECGVVVEDTEPGANPQISDLNNVLGMFFSVDGTDVGDGLNMDLKFRYNQQYVQITSPYDEGDYIAARVLSNNTTISKLGQAAVDEVSNILTFNLQGDFAGDQTAVDGDYFAGIDDAIPNTILVYRTDQTVVQVNDGSTGYDQVVPGGGAPTGAVVIVQSGDFLFFNIEGVNFYRTEIEPGGSLIIPGTKLHRLGKVTGTGTLQIGGTGNLPAGDYTDFFGCTGGRLNFQSSSGQEFEVLSNMPPISDVGFIGPGAMIIANSEVNICNNVSITNGGDVKAANSALLNVDGNIDVQNGTLDFRQGTAQIAGNLITSGNTATGGLILSGNNGVVTVEGDMLVGGKGMDIGTVARETHLEGNMEKLTNPSSGSIQDGTGGAKLVLDGIVPQTITGDFTGASDIPTLELNNGTGLTIDGNVDISEKLMLTDGNIFTDDSKVVHLTSDAVQVEPIGGQPNSFIDGPMQWTLSNTSASKKFPIGNNDRYRPLTVSNRTGSASVIWEAQYTDTTATTDPDIETMDPDPDPGIGIETVSIQEYWRVETDVSSSAQANIGLSWGDNSAVSTNTTDQSRLLVLAYNDDDADPANHFWESYGGTGFQYTPATNRGSLVSQDQISFSKKYFTLGSTDGLVNPLPVTWLYFDGENKGKDNVLVWATASEQNNDYFELERSFDARSWTSIAQIQGAGESTTTLDYSYTDQNAPYGLVYYRLKQVDFDGKSEYAPNLVSMRRDLPGGNFDFLLFPNPSDLGTVRFRASQGFDSMAKVSISDMSGKILAQEYIQIDGQGTSAPVECNFEPGVYLVTVIIDNKMRSKPLVITK